MWYNEAKFRDNGNCGYVLKPSFLINEPVTFNPYEYMKPTQMLTVTVAPSKTA